MEVGGVAFQVPRFPSPARALSGLPARCRGRPAAPTCPPRQRSRSFDSLMLQMEVGGVEPPSGRVSAQCLQA
jgi:hypothetical protein